MEREIHIKEFKSFHEFGSRNAVTSPIAAVTGNLTAHEAMMFLTGLKSPISPNFFQLDMVSMEKHDIPRKYHEKCSVCSDPSKPLDFETELYSNTSNK